MAPANKWNMRLRFLCIASVVFLGCQSSVDFDETDTTATSADATVTSADGTVASSDTAATGSDTQGPLDKDGSAPEETTATGCETDADCDDNDPCTDDSCGSDGCVHTQNDESCEEDEDGDGDGVTDDDDNCPLMDNEDQTDTDDDDLGDACDDDDDGDNVTDDDDNCPLMDNEDQTDTDDDDLGDACDDDDDGDGIDDDGDNCPLLKGDDQTDTDDDGEGDLCDDDDDGDGIDDDQDLCPLDHNPEPVDTDTDGVPNACDDDDDGDGISDGDDPCVESPNATASLETDLLNCGTCGDPCDEGDGAHVTTWSCQESACVIVACEEGYADSDPSTPGCEWTPVIHVDAWNLADQAQDGSPEHPFSDLQTGVDNSGKGYTVQVAEGIYSGPITIGQDNLTLQGAGAGATQISGEGDAPVITVSGDGISIRDLKTTGGQVGVFFAGGELSPLEGGIVKDVEISNVTGLGGGDADRVVGVYVRYVNDLNVHNVTVDGVTHESTVGVPSPDGHSVGIEDAAVIGARFEGVVGGMVEDLTIQNVIGQSGTTPFTGSPYSADGTKGVDATGVQILDSDALSLSTIHIQTVKAGDGGDGAKYAGDGGPAGVGLGVLVAGATDAVITAMSIGEVTGGDGSTVTYNSPGDAKPGPGAPAIGVRITDSTGTTLESFSVTGVKGGGGIYLNAKDGTGVEIIDGSHDTTLNGGVIAHIAAASCAAGWNPGARAWALRLIASDSAVVTGVQFHQIKGSSGCAGVTPPHAFALFIDGASSPSLSHLTFHKIGPTSDAIHAGAGQSSPVLISNSIFSHVSGTALSGATAALASNLFVSYSLFDSCATISGGATVASGIIEGIAGFVGADDGDLKLKSSSSAVDAGKPGSDYCNEPEPNGCLANLGAHGNSSEATSAIGGDHCPCTD